VCVSLTATHEALLLSRFPKLAVRREITLALAVLSTAFLQS